MGQRERSAARQQSESRAVLAPTCTSMLWGPPPRDAAVTPPSTAGTTTPSGCRGGSHHLFCPGTSSQSACEALRCFGTALWQTHCSALGAVPGRGRCPTEPEGTEPRSALRAPEPTSPPRPRSHPQPTSKEEKGTRRGNVPFSHRSPWPEQREEVTHHPAVLLRLPPPHSLPAAPGSGSSTTAEQLPVPLTESPEPPQVRAPRCPSADPTAPSTTGNHRTTEAGRSPAPPDISARPSAAAHSHEHCWRCGLQTNTVDEVCGQRSLWSTRPTVRYGLLSTWSTAKAVYV